MQYYHIIQCYIIFNRKHQVNATKQPSFFKPVQKKCSSYIIFTHLCVGCYEVVCAEILWQKKVFYLG